MPHGNHHPFPQGSLTGFCRGSSTGCRPAETSGTISQGLSSTKKSKAASLAQHLHPWMLMEEIPHLGCINWMYKIMSYSWTGAGCLPWRRSMEFKSAFGVPFAQGIYAWYFRYKHICRLSLVPFSSQSVGPRSNYTAPCWDFHIFHEVPGSCLLWQALYIHILTLKGALTPERPQQWIWNWRDASREWWKSFQSVQSCSGDVGYCLGTKPCPPRMHEAWVFPYINPEFLLDFAHQAMYEQTYDMWYACIHPFTLDCIALQKKNVPLHSMN